MIIIIIIIVIIIDIGGIKVPFCEFCEILFCRDIAPPDCRVSEPWEVIINIIIIIIIIISVIINILIIIIISSLLLVVYLFIGMLAAAAALTIVSQINYSITIVNYITLLHIYHTVSFHNFKSQNFKLSVSNPKSKHVAYVSVLSQISNCQGLGRKNKLEILKTDCNVNHYTLLPLHPPLIIITIIIIIIIIITITDITTTIIIIIIIIIQTDRIL